MSSDVALPTLDPALRPPLRAELLADNKQFVALARELLLAFRNTDDKACAVCGAEQGRQHKKSSVCHQLVEWRAHTQYKKTGS
jgi:hypothetical protein